MPRNPEKFELSSQQWEEYFEMMREKQKRGWQTPWEEEGHLHPKFKGKPEKEILKELVERKKIKPLTREELNEFHNFKFTTNVEHELNPKSIAYKHYNYGE